MNEAVNKFLLAGDKHMPLYIALLNRLQRTKKE